MKNILLTTTFFFLFIFQIRAQYIALYEETEMNISKQSLNWENQKLRSDLTLSEAQFEKIKAINQERFKARSIVDKMLKNQPNKHQAKILEIETQFDVEFQEVLNAKQFKKYLALQGRVARKPGEVVPAAEMPADPNFNVRIQEIISRATAPVVDPRLLPKQEIVTGDQDSTKVLPAAVQIETITPGSVPQKEALKPAVEEKEEIINTQLKEINIRPEDPDKATHPKTTDEIPNSDNEISERSGPE